MKTQEYKIEKIDSFEPKDIFECGQCFRWTGEEDGSYTGIFGENILNVKKENKAIIFKGQCKKDIRRNSGRIFWFKKRL